MDLNTIIQKSNKNLEQFYCDIKKIFEEIRYYLENEKGYSLTRDKRVVYNSSSSLDKPSRWFPSYVSLYMINDKNESIVISVMFRNIFEDNEPVEKLEILLGKIFGVNKNDNLKEVCIDTIFNPDWVTKKREKDGAEYTYMECDDSEEIAELGYEYGFVIQEDIFTIKDYSKWINLKINYLDGLSR